MHENLRRFSMWILIVIVPLAASPLAGLTGPLIGASTTTAGDPIVATLTLDPASVRPGSSFTATFLGTNLGDATLFDLRYRSPASDLDQVVLNWQHGKSAVHGVALDVIPGTWTITGARAHQDVDDHSAPFISLSTHLSVNSSVVSDLHLEPDSIEPDGAAFNPFTATFSGRNLTSETYFDVRYRVPCNGADQVAWNWQRGTAATHSSPADSPPGVWAITGAWAHQDVDDHGAEFAPLSTTLILRQPRVPFIGEPITSIAIDPARPDTVYAGSASGIYKTYDGGQTWMIANSKLSPHELVIDPTNPCVIYAGTNTGVFKSVDAAATWTAVGLTTASIRALAIDPQTPSILYAGTDCGCLDNASGVFKSLDGGLHWNGAGLGLPPASRISSLAVDPVNSAVVYAGADANPAVVFKSIDGGEHWGYSWLGSLNILAASIDALVVDPKHHSVIYAATINPDNGSNHNQAGTFKSIDGGATWSGLWSGSGAAYENALPGHREIESLAIDPVDSAILYAGAVNGNLFRSPDAGASWVFVNISSAHQIHALAIDPSKHSTIYAGANEGIFKSTDAGLTWKPLAH